MKKLIHLLCVLLAMCMLPVGAGAEAPVVPSMIDEKAEITVVGETDLPGNFFLSFPMSRNLMVLDGKGQVVWEKYETFLSPE